MISAGFRVLPLISSSLSSATGPVTAHTQTGGKETSAYSSLYCAVSADCRSAH